MSKSFGEQLTLLAGFCRDPEQANADALSHSLSELWDKRGDYLKINIRRVQLYLLLRILEIRLKLHAGIDITTLQGLSDYLCAAENGQRTVMVAENASFFESELSPMIAEAMGATDYLLALQQLEQGLQQLAKQPKRVMLSRFLLSAVPVLKGDIRSEEAVKAT